MNKATDNTVTAELESLVDSLAIIIKKSQRCQEIGNQAIHEVVDDTLSAETINNLSHQIRSIKASVKQAQEELQNAKESYEQHNNTN